MLGTALLAMLAAFISIGSNYMFGQCMTERPIVAGMIAGLLFGGVFYYTMEAGKWLYRYYSSPNSSQLSAYGCSL